VAFFFASAAAAMPQIEGGKVRALAVSTPARMPALPQVPTIAESGVAGFSFSIWGGLFAPAKTPPEIINLLNREINKIIRDPATRTQLEQQGAIIKANTPAEFADFVRKETAKYDQIIKQTGVVVE
jgi:tripartite-type tricarboxylate transporter receptor subunit TctC